MRLIKIVLAALGLSTLLMGAQCSQEQANTTIADIQKQIQTACNFQPTAASIAQVVATVVAGFDPAAGATAAVAVAVGNTVTTKICDAVKAQAPAPGTFSAAPGGRQITVTVNGVPVTGEYKGG